MKLLAIDCSTDACSVGLLIDGACTVEHVVAERQHAALVLDMIERLLSGADVSVTALDGIAFGRGPGSFTGLRIAAGVTQGLAYGGNVPVVGVSSLAAMAQHAFDLHGTSKVAAAFDARMGDVYIGFYAVDDTGLMGVVSEDRVCAPQDVAAPGTADGGVPRAEGVQTPGLWAGAGSGWSAHRDVLRERLGESLGSTYPELHPHAGALARLALARFEAGEGVPAAGALPVYLRDKVAERPKRLDRSPFEPL